MCDCEDEQLALGDHIHQCVREARKNLGPDTLIDYGRDLRISFDVSRRGLYFSEKSITEPIDSCVVVRNGFEKLCVSRS